MFDTQLYGWKFSFWVRISILVSRDNTENINLLGWAPYLSIFTDIYKLIALLLQLFYLLSSSLDSYA